ncbi:hypothetical protein JYK00_09265 [Thermosipho ferrireducens]|uniref:Lipoprotein n=1 Tax=Thermosipho ferrireducens TaxID=2571116 RepID=A0ABX7S8E8_9BACT|nr:hypothetical protein [Thermosipho ferrireducens]QTA37892.1 hypothetical protein JYK00_09265 [Thermosipho ferrireducens]
MPGTGRLRNNSHKYKFQVALLFIIFSGTFLISGCGILLDNIIPDFQNEKKVEVEAIYQGYYFGEASITYNDLISIEFEGTISVNDISKQINSSGPIEFDRYIPTNSLETFYVTAKNNSTINVDLVATLTYYSTTSETNPTRESTSIVFHYLDSTSLDLLNFNNLKLIFGFSNPDYSPIFLALTENDFTEKKAESDGDYINDILYTIGTYKGVNITFSTIGLKEVISGMPHARFVLPLDWNGTIYSQTDNFPVELIK